LIRPIFLQTWRRAWRRLHALSRQTLLTAAATLLLGATLLEPRWTSTHETYDFVVALDITQSMNVIDYQIDGKPADRLTYAKYALGQALPELPCGSRIGWAVFTEFRVMLLVTPIDVCENYHELMTSLDLIDGRMAWASSSEIAKGLFWGLRAVKELGSGENLVFITDGHESPPMNPHYRPIFGEDAQAEGKPYTFLDQTTWQQKLVYEGKPGDIRGLFVGVGGDQLRPIPKRDGEGRSLGFWNAGEVMQTDIYSAGHPGATAARPEAIAPNAEQIFAPTMTEHLSSLHDAYLQELATQAGFGYHRLTDAPGLLRALTAKEFARQMPYRADLRILLGGIAMALIVALQLSHFRKWRYRGRRRLVLKWPRRH
jgi:mxaL protein